MAIAFACDCGKQFTVGDEHAGKRTKCPTCGAALVVPAADAEDAAFRALSEGPEPAPAAGRPSWRDEPPAFSPPPPPPSGPSRQAQHATDAALRAAYKAEERARKRERAESRGTGFAVSRGVVAGLLMMLGAAVWFFGALALGVLFIYPPILFVLGLITFVNGLLGRSED